MQIFDSRSIIERMKDALNVKGDKELIAILNVPQSTFSNWKNRNALPAEVFVNFANERGIDLNWLLLGEEKKEQLATDEQMMLFAYRQLDTAQKAQLMMQMSGLDKGGRNGEIVQKGDGGNNHQVFHGDVREVTGIRK